MIIEWRDPENKYPVKIKKEKTRIILDWLLEFRFSSFDILAKRINSTKTNSNRFFNALINEEVIKVFKNVHTDNTRYVMLWSNGVEYLKSWGRDTEKAVTRIQKMGRYGQILHDIGVQQCALRKMQKATEVIWDRNITWQEKPDLLIKSNKGYWAALEYERWRKDKKRIYISLSNHIHWLREGKHKGVIYTFDQDSDLEHYKKIWLETEWPLYARNAKNGKIESTGESLKISKSDPIRKGFIFEKNS